jgi:hypothetical protein
LATNSGKEETKGSGTTKKPKPQRQTIVERLQMNRYRLLYYVVRKGRVYDDSTSLAKTRLKRMFGYSSDGAFYPDWEFLTRERFVEEKEGYVEATKKARTEFSFLLWGRLMQAFMIVAGATMVIFFAATTYSLRVPGVALNSPYLVYVSGIFLLGFGIASHYIYRDLTPRPPSDESNL